MKSSTPADVLFLDTWGWLVLADARDPEEELSAAARDTADARRVYRSDAGRVMRGGGGIVPDLVVRPDSGVIAAREALTRALDSNVVKYTDAIAAFALDTRARRTVTSPLFAVTPAMREDFLARLRQRNVQLDETTLRTAWPFIEQQLGAQTARFTFGRVGEVRRLSGGGDPVLAEALRLAQTAREVGPGEEIAALIANANSALEALQVARSAGVDLAAPIARDAWRTAARALDTAESELEIIIFDREGALLARTPFQRASV